LRDAGEATFGGINSEVYDGELVQIPLSNVSDLDRGTHDPDESGPPLLNGTWRVEALSILAEERGWRRGRGFDLSGFTEWLNTVEPFILLSEAMFHRLRDVIKPEHIPF
jgi:hypothetical protein